METMEEKKVMETMEEIENDFDDAERGIGDVLGGVEVEAGAYIEASSVLGKLRKKISNKFVALFAIGVLSAAGSGKASASNIEANPNPKNKTELKTSSQNAKKINNDTYIMSGEEGNPIKKVEKIKFDITTSFELGNAVIGESSAEEMKKSFSDFLKKIPDEIKEKINNGESSIIINSGCSPEKIIESGIESGRGKVYNNKELAEARAEEGIEKIIQPTLEDIGFNREVNVKYTIPENGVDKNNPTRHVTISIEDEIIIENIKNILNKTKWIISDYSPSMDEERLEVTNLIKEINNKKDDNEKVEIVKLDAGYNGMLEQHLKTIKQILSKIEKPLEEERYITIYTDEPDFNSDDTDKYEEDLKNTIDDAKKKNIKILLRAFNPKKAGESILKVLDKNDLTKTNPNTSKDMGWYNSLSSDEKK